MWFRKKIGRIEILKPLLKAGKIALICALVVYIPAATIAFISDTRIETDQWKLSKSNCRKWRCFVI